MDQRKGRARDRVGVAAGTGDQTTDEGGLTSTEVAKKQDNRPADEPSRERSTNFAASAGAIEVFFTVGSTKPTALPGTNLTLATMLEFVTGAVSGLVGIDKLSLTAGRSDRGAVLIVVNANFPGSGVACAITQ